MNQSGCNVRLRVGEELHVRLDVTNNIFYEWKDNGKHDKNVIKHQSNGVFISFSPGGIAGHLSHGEITIVYKAVGVGKTTLELIEKSGNGKGPGSGLVWSASVEVR